jgi:hypothetical protein
MWTIHGCSTHVIHAESRDEIRASCLISAVRGGSSSAIRYSSVRYTDRLMRSDHGLVFLERVGTLLHAQVVDSQLPANLI